MTMLLAAPKPLTLNVQPQIALAPHDLQVRLHVVRAPENRTLAWACDSIDGMRASSEIPLDGDRSPTSFERWVKAASAGDYECRAVLLRQGATPLYAPPVYVHLLAP